MRKEIDKLEQIQENTHYTSVGKSVLILGSGFSGIEVLRRLQKQRLDNKDITITLVSKDNFLLFTPMLHDVSTGTIEIRHIVTPTRSFCKKAKFYQAEIESIDLLARRVVTRHIIGKQLLLMTGVNAYLTMITLSYP
jgi:NADH dehydrogenase